MRSPGKFCKSESGYPHPIQEMTTVSRKLRRVVGFDWDLALSAAKINRPTRIAINGLDNLCYDDRGITSVEALSSRSREFVGQLYARLGISVACLGVGSRLDQILADWDIKSQTDEPLASVVC